MRPATPSGPPSPQVPTPAWREFKDLQEWEKYGQERPGGDKVSTFVDQLFDTIENMGRGSPERVPGALFRGLAALFVRGHPAVSWGALARELSQRLASSGIHYHLRTLRRQLSGAVSTVPPEVEEAMRQILRERDGLTRDEDVERALAASGIEIPQGERLSAHVMVERILPLVELWFHLNPGKSKRFLASRLRNDLGDEARRSTIDSLQSVLAGEKRLVQRAVHRLLLGYLAELGATSEEEAKVRARELHQDIRRSLRRRSFVDASRFRQLCRLLAGPPSRAVNETPGCLAAREAFGVGDFGPRQTPTDDH